MNRDFHLFLAIILIRTDENGFSYFAPEEIPAQIAVDLTEFQETWIIGQIEKSALERTVQKILREFSALFDCPIAWRITMNESVDSTNLRILKTSNRMMFLPSKGVDTVNLDFLDEWFDPNEKVQVFDEEFEN